MTTVADCPSCGMKVTIGKEPRMGGRITCNHCDEVLEIVWLHPVELDWPIDDDDDDDDYDEDQDYYEDEYDIDEDEEDEEVEEDLDDEDN